jgi:hypothetical protein
MPKVLFLKKLLFNLKLSGVFHSSNSKKNTRYEIYVFKNEQISMNLAFGN